MIYTSLKIIIKKKESTTHYTYYSGIFTEKKFGALLRGHDLPSRPSPYFTSLVYFIMFRLLLFTVRLCSSVVSLFIVGHVLRFIYYLGRLKGLIVVATS